MGICLALSILEHGAPGGPHGGWSEAIDELIRESFWMTEPELDRAYSWALKRSPMLEVAIDVERTRRRGNAPIGHRVN
jgi:hypothetical protein